MNFIIELRVNGKELIHRVSEAQGRELQVKQERGKMPATIMLNRETIASENIQRISPVDVWWESDRVSQASHGKQRCFHCFITRPFGESCECNESRIQRAGMLDPQTQTYGQGAITPERLTVGMRRAISIALLYPNVTLETKMVKNFLQQFHVKPSELPVPTNDQIEMAMKRTNGQSRSFKAWREVIAGLDPEASTSRRPQEGGKVASEPPDSTYEAEEGIDEVLEGNLDLIREVG